ncbi:MAG: hypothetical protein GVY24_04590 [Planctomycetes bacterium]|jgi:glycosidase|nr:hypothetical protein [Planctomycetota bacterium]
MTRSRAAHRLLIVSACLMCFPAAWAEEHTFVLDTRQWDEQPQSVHVAGTFNGWSKDATPMRPDSRGLYRATVDLPDGVHQYKFVIDGERWVRDAEHTDAELEAPDGHGGMNSAVLIGFDARELPPPRADHINIEALRHDPQSDARVVATGRMIILAAQAQADDVQRVTATLTESDGVTHEAPLHHTRRHLGWDHFAALVPVRSQHLRYRLTYADGDATVETSAHELEAIAPFETPDWAKDAVWYQVFVERFRNGDPSNDPGEAWYENRLPWTADWWQTHEAYGEAPGAENFYAGAGNAWKRRFGGDLQGVREKLPYLRRLGVNALYFNPIFEADSAHKYDTSDFRHIDDNFGVKGDLPIAGETEDPATWRWSASDKVFLDFIEEAHRQGFRVIIDGVFNHVGRSHPFFLDVLRHGRDSRYADWFEIMSWGQVPADRFGDDATIDELLEVHGKPGGIQWRAWDGDNGHLPTFRKDPKLGLAPGPRQHIFDITTRWLAPDGDPGKGVDGFRLDVPGDIPHPFWIDWRKHVKSIKPEAYLTGEIWSFAHPWLAGDQFDATMNYPFAYAAEAFFADRQTAIPPSEFARRLREVAYAYPLQVALVQQNLLDSHDTDRFASRIVNPDRGYDVRNRMQDPEADFDPRKPNATEWRRFMQAVTCQFTFPGAPLIYYGNEAGMWSPDDPSNRMPMLWRDLEPYDMPGYTFHERVFHHHQRLIALRHQVEPLRRGFFRVVHTDDEAGVIVYDRFLEDEHVYIALNRSPERRRIDLKIDNRQGRWRNLLDPVVADLVPPEDKADARPVLMPRPDAQTLTVRHGAISVVLDAYDGAVLVPAEE